MIRYKLKVDSTIGPIIVLTVGKNFSDAWNKLRKEICGITNLIQILSEEKI